MLLPTQVPGNQAVGSCQDRGGQGRGRLSPHASATLTQPEARALLRAHAYVLTSTREGGGYGQAVCKGPLTLGSGDEGQGMCHKSPVTRSLVG